MELRTFIAKIISECLNESQIEQIINTGISISDKIEGGFLNKKQAEELQKKIESNYNNSGISKLGQDNNDIRQSLYNYNNPLAEKDVNGVNLRITSGLIEGEPYSGKRRNTYLLYADGKIVGKFYSVDDIKRIVKHIEDNLIFPELKEVFNKTLHQTSKYFANIGLKTEDVFDMIQYHDSYRDLYPNYSDLENEYEEDYYFPTKEDAYNDVNETLELFNTLPNPIPIYRSIKVKSMDDINYDWLGDYWSFDKQSAINFAKNHGMGNILLIGKTKFDNVNWNNTIKAWYLFSGNYNSFDENEITIIDSDEIFDVEIERI